MTGTPVSVSSTLVTFTAMVWLVVCSPVPRAARRRHHHDVLVVRRFVDRVRARLILRES